MKVINKYIGIVAILAFSGVALAGETVRNKLNRIIVEKVGIDDGFTMDEVIELLSDASGGEINFLYAPALEVEQGPLPPQPNPNGFPFNGLPAPVDPTVGNVNGVPPIGIPSPIIPTRIDPNTGLPLSPPVLGNPAFLVKREVEPKIRGVRLQLKNVSLRQLVDIVSMSFDKPVQSVVTPWGVVFVPRKTSLLFNRVYQINPKRLNNMKKPNKK